MDVSRVLDLVCPFFESRKEPYALVGGLALLAYGAPRATFDVDLLAPRRTRDDLVAFLEERGFTTLGVQPGFSSHHHSEPALGRVDVIDLQFLLALPGLDREESRGYFESAGLADYFERLDRR